MRSGEGLRQRGADVPACPCHQDRLAHVLVCIDRNAELVTEVSEMVYVECLHR